MINSYTLSKTCITLRVQKANDLVDFSPNVLLLYSIFLGWILSFRYYSFKLRLTKSKYLTQKS